MTKMQGLAKLRRKLAKLPSVAEAMIRRTMEAKADEIVAMMKSLVPVDDGKLRDSIGWTWGKAPKGSISIGSVRASSGNDLTLTIYAGNSEAYYARWVEFGTSPHENKGLFAGSDHPGTAPQPFFYVSWRANKKRVVRAVRKSVRDAAKKVAAGS
jgi:HK97 gp10 family phage protein